MNENKILKEKLEEAKISFAQMECFMSPNNILDGTENFLCYETTLLHIDSLVEEVKEEFKRWKDDGEKHTGIPKHQLEKIERVILGFIK